MFDALAEHMAGIQERRGWLLAWLWFAQIPISGILIAALLISYMSWSVDRNYPDLCGKEECGTYHGYVIYNLKKFGEQLKHL